MGIHLPLFIWLILLVADPLSGMLWQGIQQPMVRRKDLAPKAEWAMGSERLMGRQFLRKVDREAGADWEKESRKME